MTSSPQPGVFCTSGPEHLEPLYFQVVRLLLANASKLRRWPNRFPEWGLTQQGGPPRNFVRHFGATSTCKHREGDKTTRPSVRRRRRVLRRGVYSEVMPPLSFPFETPARRTRFGLFPRHVIPLNSLECCHYLLLVAPFEGHVQIIVAPFGPYHSWGSDPQVPLIGRGFPLRFSPYISL
jgi:hypothetical protein